MVDGGFEIGERLTELRCRDTSWLRQREAELTRRERETRVERLAVQCVLDERGVAATSDAASTYATTRAEAEVSRRLESLPAIAAAAHAGALSWDQLKPIIELATPETDAEWAVRATRVAPSDLARMVRQQRVVSPEDAEARREARGLRWWRSRDHGMLHLRGAIPDVDGALVEEVFEHLVNAMKPPRGMPWDSRAHRGADALVELCRNHQSGARPATRWRPRVIVHVGSDAQPTVNGLPLALSTVQRLIDDGATVRQVCDDDPLAPTVGDAIPAALRDYLKARDGQCRRPGCERTFGLDAHHLVPRAYGGTTDKHNVVLVCRPDHRLLPPHGPARLEGDPEQPDGLTWRHHDEPEHGAADARAGP